MYRILLSSVFLVLCLPAFSAPAQIDFVAVLKDVTIDTPETGTLTLQLTPDFEAQVRVTELTEIRGPDDAELTLSDLDPGMVLKIRGTFTSTGIMAQDVIVTEMVGDFALKGLVEAVDLANRTITVLGLIIQVPEDAIIKDAEGNLISLADLEPLQFVCVAGHQVEGAFVASQIRVRLPGLKPPRVAFEGIIEAMAGSDLKVAIKDVATVVVHITPKTEVKGQLAVGVLVRVYGTLEPDLSVTAEKIIAQVLFKVVPEALKMDLNQTRRLEVILGARFDQDVELAVTSLNPAIVKPSLDKLVIPAGKITGFFNVTSAATEGETTVEVALPATLGGAKCVVKVQVEKRGNGGIVPKQMIAWRPNSVKMGTQETRKVGLHLALPAAAGLEVVLSLNKGASGIVEFPPKVTFNAGSKSTEVAIKTGAATGKVEIRATLPASAGGGYSDLQVDVSQK